MDSNLARGWCWVLSGVVLVGRSGRDASDDFDDVGHSKTAITLMEKYIVGDLQVRPPSRCAPCV